MDFRRLVEEEEESDRSLDRGLLSKILIYRLHTILLLKVSNKESRVLVGAFEMENSSNMS